MNKGRMMRIEVVAAIIRKGDKIFATQRGYGEFKDWWEFPGGKMEPGESPEDALVREIREELDAEISIDKYLYTVEWDYPKFHLTMHCYMSSLLNEAIHLNEHEAARWLTKEDINSVKWLPADLILLPKIVKELEESRIRKFGTCFFEQYAQISLSALLGREFESLVNLDRPDLQSPAGRAIGIEVTRAMEESREAEEELLKDLSGFTRTQEDEDIDNILEYGYAFGLHCGKYIGIRELPYWKMALPMRRIIESKVAKVGSGFYGNFDKMGLFVFSKDNLGEADALKTMNYTISIQKYQDIRYNRLYLADVDDLFVCNLDDGITPGSRLIRYKISQEQRREFYLEAVRRQLGQ